MEFIKHFVMATVDLRTYRYFCAVARSGSVRIAAEACSVTQPAISRQIAMLEETLSVTLFQRRPSGMVLTAAGSALYGNALKLLNQAERVERSVIPWHGSGATFRVACLDTTLHHIMAPFIAETGADISDLRPERAHNIYATLEESMDIAVATAAPPRGKESQLLARAPISVHYRSDMLSADFNGELRDISTVPIVIAGQGSAVEHIVRDATEIIGLELIISSVVSSGRMAQAAAASRPVVAITTEPSLFGLETQTAKIDEIVLSTPLYAVWDTGHPSDKKIRQLVASLSAWLHESQPWKPKTNP
ncbi:LysR family transcriptional regulator [Rhizobium sp. BR 249]|uniref:LysR family transcriptional regulator n=1 Tax=Rhizobium sp. BR 249 TaxID=3040011 RepID=UPI0039BFC477